MYVEQKKSKIACNIFQLSNLEFWDNNITEEKKRKILGLKHFLLSSIKKRSIKETWKLKKKISKINVFFTPRNILHSAFYFLYKDDEDGDEYIAFDIKLENLYKQNNFLFYFADKPENVEDLEKYIRANISKARQEFKRIREGELKPEFSDFNYLLEYRLVELFRAGVMKATFEINEISNERICDEE